MAMKKFNIQFILKNIKSSESPFSSPSKAAKQFLWKNHFVALIAYVPLEFNSLIFGNYAKGIPIGVCNLFLEICFLRR